MLIAKKTPVTPLYSTLSNIELILDSTGLRWGTTNNYGVVDAIGSVTTWKSIAPGPTGRDFASGGVGPGLTGSPLKLIDGFVNFGGAAFAGSTSAIGTFNGMSYNATPANFKTTVHIVCKIGKESNPDWLYGLFGNNQTSSSNKGIYARYEDRVPRNNGYTGSLTNGSANVILGNIDNIISANTPFVFTIENDLSQAEADRQKIYINGVQIIMSATSPTTTLITTPSNPMQIGATGNNIFPMFGWISHVIMQTTVESSAVRTAFINSLLPYKNQKANQFYQIDESRIYTQSIFLDESTYYLNVAVEKNPVTGIVLCVFGNWTNAGHTWAEANFVAFRKSTDNGKTFAAKQTAFSPVGTEGVLDCGFFFDTNGIGHGFTNTYDGSGTTPTPGTSELWYFSTANDGDTWSNQQITTPSDGLTINAAYGNGYTSDGFNFFTVYRIDNTASNSAIYVLRWPVGGDIAIDLVWKLIYSGTIYRNESTIGRIGTNSHILIARDEVTLEWHQYRTTNNWDTVTDDGIQDFGGEVNTGAGPCRITMYNITSYNGSTVTPCLNCFYPKRGTAELKMISAKASDLLATGTWDLDTKTLIVDDTEFVHYGGVYQVDNTFNFLAIYSRELATVLNNLIYFTGPTTQYARTKTELGL